MVCVAASGRGFMAEGKLLEALHLLDIAPAAAPDCALGKAAKRDALILLNERSGGKNLWERMSIAAELRELEEGDLRAS